MAVGTQAQLVSWAHSGTISLRLACSIRPRLRVTVKLASRWSQRQVMSNAERRDSLSIVFSSSRTSFAEAFAAIIPPNIAACWRCSSFHKPYPSLSAGMNSASFCQSCSFCESRIRFAEFGNVSSIAGQDPRRRRCFSEALSAQGAALPALDQWHALGQRSDGFCPSLDEAFASPLPLWLRLGCRRVLPLSVLGRRTLHVTLGSLA